MFVPFPRLPFELRRAIWKLCLPKHRIMEIDRPPEKHNEKHGEKADWQISFANSRPPLLTRVCRESRSVAFENGGINGLNVNTESIRTPGFERFIENAWFNPETDVVHMNYNSRFENLAWDAVPITPIPYLLATTEKGVAASITADFLFPFRIRMTPQLFRGANFHQLGLLEGRKEYLVSLRLHNLHLDQEAVLKSGLFGQLGEERIILVDVEDSEKLRQIYDLSKASNRGDDEPEGKFAQFFNLAVSRPEQFKRTLDKWRYGLKSHWIFGLKVQQVCANAPGQAQVLGVEIARAPTAQEVRDFEEDHLGGWQYVFFEEDHPFVKTVLVSTQLL